MTKNRVDGWESNHVKAFATNQGRRGGEGMIIKAVECASTHRKRVGGQAGVKTKVSQSDADKYRTIGGWVGVNEHQNG